MKKYNKSIIKRCVAFWKRLCYADSKRSGRNEKECVGCGTVQDRLCHTKNFRRKWKIEIVYYIAFQNVHHFGELRRHIGDITESSLTKQLRELEADGFITRHDYQEVPPHVEYNLTDFGKSFIPVFEHMKQWGEENL